MKAIKSLIFSLLSLSCGAAPDSTWCIPKPDSLHHSPVYILPEKKAVYPGGDKAFILALSESLELPADYYLWSERIRLSFIVDSSGCVCNAMVCNDKLPEDLRKALIDALYKLPTWQPAEHKGRKVHSRIYLPVYLCFE